MLGLWKRHWGEFQWKKAVNVAYYVFKMWCVQSQCQSNVTPTYVEKMAGQRLPGKMEVVFDVSLPQQHIVALAHCEPHADQEKMACVYWRAPMKYCRTLLYVSS